MRQFPFVLLLLSSSFGISAENLLLNPDFRFSSISPLQIARSSSAESGSVPFWESNGYDQIRVVRGPSVEGFTPRYPVEAAVRVEPGGALSQWVLLSETRLEPGTPISFAVDGFQTDGAALTIRLQTLMTDAQPGQWSPKEFGQNDQRTFPRAARGELTPRKLGETTATLGDFEARLENLLIPASKKGEPQPVAIEVEFINNGSAPAWVYAPRLVSGATVPSALLPGAALPDTYRSIPRTITRLQAGQPVHIIVMGSSIDRASMNPPAYRYDENPDSPTFKQPLSAAGRLFEGEEIGRPELTPYYGWWQHYFSYGGRLRLRLMKRFNLTPDKVLINFMAADGSSIGESHSALESWSSLAHPPSPGGNGHRSGTQWSELYPGLFSRPEGPRPDLVIFGSGANERIDGVDEVAVYEGAIRWFQRHYPGTEFLVAMWNHQERYTHGAAMMRQLALRYGLPVIEVGRSLHLSTRHVDPLHFVPKDGHPQAAAHDLWGRQIERAFQPTDPIGAGLPQAHLPERLSHYTLNWEGETTTFPANSPRIRNGRSFIVEDAAFNVWATAGEPAVKKVEFCLNGRPSKDRAFGNGSRFVPLKNRDERNSSFVVGRLPLGERHFVELMTPGATIVAADMKTALNRRWHPVSSAQWVGKSGEPVAFTSQWGAPYGSQRLDLVPGKPVKLRWVGTLASIAWLQQQGGGTIVAKVSDQTLSRPTGTPTTLADGNPDFMEDRAPLPLLPYGVHELEVTAEGGPVALLGAFTYDTRANRSNERQLSGFAAPGETIRFSAPFRATPLVLSQDGLEVGEVNRETVTFGGSRVAPYQIIGE